MSPAAAEIGSTASSYAILAKLATGGMAEIYLARGASVAGVERYVVLKRVLRERAADPHFIRMFLDEARLAAQLQHPNIAQVYDIGKLGDTYFFTMEYVHGETVRALLQRAHALKRPVPIGCMLAIAAGAAAGLHHAHERIGVDGRPLGIVHRDVSPSNLMITYDGNVKVVDFGVAKASHRATETRSGTVKGKISYLSPEQCRGRGIDRRSDLFSLGIVMWELLTLERLYRRDSDFENMQAIVNEPVRPPSAYRNDLGGAIDAVVLRTLAKDPDQRFQSAEELLEAIDAVAVQAGSSLSTAGLGRFVREMFGQRPEPWLELQAEARHSDVVTVTGEPIPAELVLPVAPALDRELARVPDLAATESDSNVEVGKPTVPMPRVPPPDGVPTLPQRVVRPSAQPLHTLIGTAAPAPYSYSQSSSVPAIPAYAAAPAPQHAHQVSRWWVIVPALAVGAVIGLVIALRGRHDEPPATTVAMAAVAAPLDAPAAPVAPVEPAPIFVPVTDAGLPMGAVTEPAVAVDAGSAPEPTVRVVKKPSPPRPRPPTIAELYEGGRLGEVVSACASSASSYLCALAACKLGDGAKARRWFSTVAASKRAIVTAGCEQAGITLEKKRDPDKSTPDCKSDPMACQR